MSVRPSVRMEKLGIHVTDFRRNWYFSTFRNLFRKISGLVLFPFIDSCIV